jgi:hypothetical protein
MNEPLTHEIALVGPTGTLTYRLPGEWRAVNSTQQLTAVGRALNIAAAVDAKTVADGEEPDPRPGHSLGQSMARMHLLTELLELPMAVVEQLPPLEAFIYPHTYTPDGGGYYVEDVTEYRVLPQLDWAFEAPRYDKSLLPVIEHDGTTWHGPDDDLNTFSVKRWLWCATLANAFRASDAESALKNLNNLMGALYHPADAGAWSNEVIEANAARLSTLETETRLAAVLNFEAIYSTLPATYKRVFDPRNSEEAGPAGLFGLAFDVAKSGVMGDEESVMCKRMHKVLLYCEHHLHQQAMDEKRAKEAEKEAKRNSH